MEPRWIFPEKPDREQRRRLAEELNVPTIIVQILLNRRIDSFEKARKFLKPSLHDLYDPFLMADMDRATDRLIRAIRENEPIMVYGDYDVDGVSGVALLVRVLSRIGAKVFFYIPHRLSEGYGLSTAAIQEAQQQGIRLILSVDCGITAMEEVDLASKLGIDVLITDHHQPKHELPRACAILDAKREDCSYPFKELAGTGVVFKLAQALLERLRLDPTLLYRNVDLVALGSAADIVPIVDENRVLVKLGLERMAHTENIGLAALLRNVHLKGRPLGTGQIVFVIGPRINAVGRMGSALKAVRLLTTDNEQQANNIAQILEADNRRRKDIDEETFTQALELAEQNVDPDHDSAVVLAAEGWHQGVIGIVASRIVEKFHLPTILISLDGPMGKGSGRSIPGFDLYSALQACQEWLDAFGGHRYAAGLTIHRDQVDPFREAFQRIAQERLTEDMRVPQLRVDGEITLGQIKPRLLQLLKHFAPFGPQNMKPVLVSRCLEVVGSPAVVGNNHLKFRVRQDGKIFDCIGFGMADLLYRVTPGEANLDAAYVIEENEWMGQRRIQLRLKGLR